MHSILQVAESKPGSWNQLHIFTYDAHALIQQYYFKNEDSYFLNKYSDNANLC